jgi:ABC-type Fe3+-hydroxamate transport system substrate-binding protein
MGKSASYGIVAAAVVAAGIGIAFAAASMRSPASNSQLTSDSANEVRVIKHAMGETEITGRPERIVSVDDELTTDMLILGAGDLLVGISFWEAFGFGFEDEMQRLGLDVPSGASHIGDYWQPNLELVAELEPDLILRSSSGSGSEEYEALSEIAPTIILDTYPPAVSSLEERERSFMALADAIGYHDQGVTVLDRFHAKLDDAAAKIETAGLKGEKFLLAEAWMFEEQLNIQLHVPDSLPSRTLERIGLQNALTSNERPEGLLHTTDVGAEGLASLAIENPGLHFFFVSYNEIDKRYDISGEIRSHSVLSDLGFMKEGRIYELGNNAQPKQTIRHMELLVDAVAELLTSK